MKKGTGFVYPTGRGSSRSGVHPQRRGAAADRARLQFERVPSPRKRKRSPEQSSAPSDLPGKRQSKPAEQNSEEDEDFLDQLGTAALEEYELTQRSSVGSCGSAVAAPKPTWQSSSTAAAPLTAAAHQQIQHTTVPTASHVRSKQGASTGLTKFQGGVHTAGSAGECRERLPSGECRERLPSGECREKVSSGEYREKVPSGEYRERLPSGEYREKVPSVGSREERETSGEAEERVRELSKRLKELEEKGYERDGEVKMLRTELKKKEDLLRETHSRLVSEHRQKEDEFSRRARSLSTQLEFKEQELSSLREKCSTLEQRHKNQASVVHTSPIPHSRPPQKPGPSGQKNSDFLSTETFMPLSQMSQADITPVHVSSVPKRVSREDSTPQAKRSTTQESPHTPGPSTRAAGATNHEPRTTPPSLKTVSPEFEEPPLLRLPPREMSSRELLMLLARPELLNVPKFRDKDDEDSPEEDSDSSSLLLESDGSSLPGLFSLLHIPQSSTSSARSTPHLPSGAGLTTPVSKLHETTPTSAGNSISNPSSEQSYDSNTPSTPVRKSRPHFRGRPPHTCGRTDMFRARVAKEDFPLRKAQSASNTPTHESSSDPLLSEREPEGVSQSLLDSLNVESLAESVRSMLTDSDFSILSQSGFSSHTTTPFPSEPPSLSPSMAPPDCGIRDGDSPGVEVQLLEHIGDVVIHYVAEQMDQAQSSNGASNNSEHESVSENTQQSPKSSVGSNTASSSRNSSDLNRPSKADQSFLHRSLGVLETLLKYSSKARDQLIGPLPPKYSLDDEVAPTVLETELNREAEGTSEEGEEMEEEEEEGEGGEGESLGSLETPTTSRDAKETKPRTVVWKGQLLEQMMPTGELSRVWLPRREEPSSEELSSWDFRRRSTSVPLAVTPYGRGAKETGEVLGRRRRNSASLGRKGGELLSSLLRLASPQWKESNEVVLLGLRLLFVLAQECSSEELERLSSLLDRDGLDSYLAEEPCDPHLCLESLKLLTCLSNAPHLTSLLCSTGDTLEGCLLQLCYEFFTRKVTEDANLQHMIHVQLVHLVSNISVVEGGPTILFGSTCACCMELLTSIVTLVQNLVQDACSSEDLTRPNVLLLCSLVVLLNRIYLIDPYFDTHRDSCSYVFLYSIRTLKFLFEDYSEVNSTIKCILSELYSEFCEEDMLDASEGSGEDEETQTTA